MTSPADVFVGREREMAELAAALDEAMAGRGNMVMLVGEPGIGKTRTAEELAAIAAGQGAEVLWGRCEEAAGAPPFWPWAQVMRTHVGRSADDVLRKQLGGGASEVAQLAPEIGQRLAGLPPPRVEDPQQARFRLFDAVTTCLRRIATQNPLLLVLDDLHWGDESSLKLLEHVAPEVAGERILILGTYRDVEVSRGHALFRSLGQLNRQRHFKRVVLRGLGTDEVRQVLESVGASLPPPDLVRLIHSHTEGNPFFIREVVALLRDEDLLGHEHLADLKKWDFRLPEGVKEVIGRRMDRLSPQCNAVLAVAAAIGREFDAGILGRLVTIRAPGGSPGAHPDAGATEPDQPHDRPSLGFQRPSPTLAAAAGRPKHGSRATSDEQPVPEGMLLEFLEEALAARLIEDMPGRVGHYRFSHALIKTTLEGEFSAARRVRLHAVIGRILEETYGEAADQHAPELAEHFTQAEPLLGHEKAVRYSQLAGERALDQLAFAEAQAYLETAFGMLEGSGDELAIAGCLHGLGRAQAANLQRYELQRAVDSITRSFDLYLHNGEPQSALQVAETYLPPLHDLQGVAAMLERALPLAETGSLGQARLLERYGLFLHMERGDAAPALAALDRALTIAERLADARLQMRVHTAAAQVLTYSGQRIKALERARAAIDLASAAGEPGVEVTARFIATGVLLGIAGDLGAAKVTALASIGPAEAIHSRHHFIDAMLMNSATALAEGTWGTAWAYVERGLQSDPNEHRLLQTTVMIRYATWEFAGGKQALEKLIEISGDPRRGLQAHLFLALCLGFAFFRSSEPYRLDLAEELSKSVIADSAQHDVGKGFGRSALGFIAIGRGDRDAATRIYDQIGKVSVDGTQGMCRARFHGLLAQTAWMWEAAARHFEEALAYCRKGGFRPELAWTCHDYAALLLDQGGRPNRSAITALLDEAEPIAVELRMEPLVTRILALRARLAAHPGGRPEYPDGLTEREVEVLRLIAAGQSNAEIAEALIITPNTAAKHVANILTKINASNRAEAASYAHQHGLMGQRPK